MVETRDNDGRIPTLSLVCNKIKINKMNNVVFFESDDHISIIEEDFLTESGDLIDDSNWLEHVI